MKDFSEALEISGDEFEPMSVCLDLAVARNL